MSVARHMFYGSFGTQKTMVTFISEFDPRKGQAQVKLGQISKFKIFLPKRCHFVSGFPKNEIYFYVHQLEMPKIEFQKVTFTWFLTIAQPNIKILI